MAFRIRDEESVAHGLQRLASKSLRAALDELSGPPSPSDEAIHSARKHLKKARAILHTLQAVDGGLHLHEERLRKVSHILSPLRDAGAMRTMLATLKDRNPGLFSEFAFAQLSGHLAAHRQELRDLATRDNVWEKVRRLLGRLQRAPQQWQASSDQFGALAPGLRRTHQDGRVAMSRALRRQGAEDFHEWRKAIKALCYQLRLLELCGPDVSRDIAALRQAEAWLGDDHTLAVLCDHLSTHAVSRSAAVDFEQVQLAADRYGSDLRKKATAAVHALYERKSGAYVREIKRAWEARPRPAVAANRSVIHFSSQQQ